MAERVLVVCPQGLLLVSERGELLSRRGWEGELREVLKCFIDGEVREEERAFAVLSKATATTSPRLSAALGLPLKRDVPLPPTDWAGEDIRRGLIELTRERSLEMWRREGAIMMATGALKDLQKASNILKERVVYWAQGHLPLGEDLDEDDILRRVSEGALGEVPDGERGVLKALGEEVGRLEGLEEALKEFIKREMERTCPNMSAVATPVLGAQLITLAGGLDRLSRFPSSTVQLLGAESGFFRFLKEGGRPPKHGAIFQHPLVQSAKPWNRGRVARALSGKITIAARIDAAGGENMGEELREDLKRRVEEIERAHPSPPRREGRGRKERKGRGRRKS